MVKLNDFSRPLSVYPVFFKANLIFNAFSRQSCLFKYFSSLCDQISSFWAIENTFLFIDCNLPSKINQLVTSVLITNRLMSLIVKKI